MSKSKFLKDRLASIMDDFIFWLLFAGGAAVITWLAANSAYVTGLPLYQVMLIGCGVFCMFAVGVNLISLAIKRHQKATAPAPNLICLGAREAKAEFGYGDLYYEDFRGSRGSQAVVVMDFKNAPSPSHLVTEATAVRANIEYSEVGGAHRCRVHHGCWLKERDEAISFPVGGIKSLVVAMKSAGWVAFEHNIETDRVYEDENDEKGTERSSYEPSLKPLTGKQYKVKVEVAGGPYGEVRKEINLTLTLEPDVKIETT